MFSLVWFIRYLFNDLQPFEQRLVADFLGLRSSAMRPHWSRLRRALTNDWRDLGHALINVPVEWAKLDPQRAVKVGILDQAFVWMVIVVL